MSNMKGAKCPKCSAKLKLNRKERYYWCTRDGFVRDIRRFDDNTLCRMTDEEFYENRLKKKVH